MSSLETIPFEGTIESLHVATGNRISSIIAHTLLMRIVAGGRVPLVDIKSIDTHRHVVALLMIAHDGSGPIPNGRNQVTISYAGRQHADDHMESEHRAEAKIINGHGTITEVAGHDRDHQDTSVVADES